MSRTYNNTSLVPRQYRAIAHSPRGQGKVVIQLTGDIGSTEIVPAEFDEDLME